MELASSIPYEPSKVPAGLVPTIVLQIHDL